MTGKARRNFVHISLTREKSRHITVDARLAGRSARFIVDTGAGGTVVDSSRATEYNLKLRSHSKKDGGVWPTCSFELGARLANLFFLPQKLLLVAASG